VNELGITVIAPNVRGSTGYGRSYVGLDNGMKRHESVADIGALLDWIATQPDMDKGRVGVSGGSYGGFMVLASLVAYPERLRCGVDSVGISNFVSFLENTEGYRRDLRRVEYGDERIPEMRAYLETVSPLNKVDRIVDPLFVVQGANDPRVPQSEAEQIVRSLRERDRTVWYLLAKDEGHGFRKKVNRDYLARATTVFLERYLVGVE
jgi:dipeptidyl aminopeptidase/acylaminoacyl peptidase